MAGTVLHVRIDIRSKGEIRLIQISLTFYRYECSDYGGKDEDSSIVIAG